MRVEIRVPNLAGAGALCEYARHRLLSRLSHELRAIEMLTISLTPVGGPGAAVIRCRMLARVSPVVHMAVEETNSCAHAAIDTASERLALVLQGGGRPPRGLAGRVRVAEAARKGGAGVSAGHSPSGRGRSRRERGKRRRGASRYGTQIS